MFYYFYLTVATIAYIVAIPFLIIFSFKTKYKESIPARFFLKNNKSLTPDGVHFHVCSLGEARAIRAISNELDNSKLRFTSTTNTGFNVIKEYSKEARYLPFEIFLPFWIKRQKVLVVFEAELWYMLFAVNKKKGAKTFLINARISEKSYKSYLRFKWLYKQIFKNIDAVYAQSFEDARRLKTLGAKHIKVNGNIKFFNLPTPNKMYNKNYDLVVCAASTHEGEEELILNAFLELKDIEDAQLIVVPRHPERFDKVAKLLERTALKKDLSFSRYTQNRDFKTDIVLIDIMGELVNAYAISDIVVLGGAFANIGGHNAAEAAQFGCKIISGVNHFNQKDIFKSIDGIEVVEDFDLTQTLLGYNELKHCKIDTKAKIDELIEDIKSVL